MPPLRERVEDQIAKRFYSICWRARVRRGREPPLSEIRRHCAKRALGRFYCVLLQPPRRHSPHGMGCATPSAERSRHEPGPLRPGSCGKEGGCRGMKRRGPPIDHSTRVVPRRPGLTRDGDGSRVLASIDASAAAAIPATLVTIARHGGGERRFAHGRHGRAGFPSQELTPAFRPALCGIGIHCPQTMRRA